MITKEEIKATIIKTFPNVESIYIHAGSVSFETEFGDVTFDKLEVLSKAFGTKNINIERGYYGPGCDTCGHGATHMVQINIKKMRLESK